MPRGPSSAHLAATRHHSQYLGGAFAELAIRAPRWRNWRNAAACRRACSSLLRVEGRHLYDLLHAYMTRLQSLVIEVASRDLPAREALAETIRRFVREYESSRSRHIVLLNDVKYLPPTERETVIALERSVVQAFADLISSTYQIDEGRQGAHHERVWHSELDIYLAQPGGRSPTRSTRKRWWVFSKAASMAAPPVCSTFRSKTENRIWKTSCLEPLVTVENWTTWPAWR